MQTRKVRGVIRNPKERIPLEAKELPSGTCNQSYAEKTNRGIEIQKFVSSNTRKNYRSQYTFRKNPNAGKFGNPIVRTIRKGIEIEKRPECLNKRDNGQRLPEGSYKQIQIIDSPIIDIIGINKIQLYPSLNYG